MNKNRKVNFYKIRKEGGARVIALTPFLPSDWTLVKVTVVRRDMGLPDPNITLKIERIA